MRYDRLLQALDKVRAEYETKVRDLLARSLAEDRATAQAILTKPKTQLDVSPASAAWTPARRAKQSKLMKRRMRAKHGKTPKS